MSIDVANRYSQLIEYVFSNKYTEGATEVDFIREDLINAASELHIETPLNIGDIIYSFRYRVKLPDSILNRAPVGSEWIIRPKGKSKYQFSLTTMSRVNPNMLLAETKIPDATPGIIERYALTDEQGLLAKLRYNRLIDIFLGVTCYSLQNHLRTTVPGIGQVETDEIYVGLDKRGAQYIIPVQAKGGTDYIGTVQIEQDIALCVAKFPHLVYRPVAAQLVNNEIIALFLFEKSENGIRISEEKHYRLVPQEEMTDTEISAYCGR